jgi:hypothetical protein
MTAGSQVTAHNDPVTPYDTRLATRIPGDLDRRLRLLAVLTRRPLTHVVADLLSKQLPTETELAIQLQQMGAGADAQH